MAGCPLISLTYVLTSSNGYCRSVQKSFGIQFIAMEKVFEHTFDTCRVVVPDDYGL